MNETLNIRLVIYTLIIIVQLFSSACAQETEISFKRVEDVINNAIEDSAFPGAVITVSLNGRILLNKAFGNQTYDADAIPMTTNTIFDIASLTKVIATTTAAMICIDRKLFNLDDVVINFIPSFSSNQKEKITIRNLLLHNSGLPAGKQFYSKYNSEKEVLNDIFSTKLIYEPGTKTVYSDLGIIVLGKIIEAVTKKSLDKFCSDEIFKPIGMNNTFFNPPATLLNRIAPTEFDNYWRMRLVHGDVHDETASLLNGVAGNAGLFSTTGDVQKLLQMFLNKGSFEGRQLIKSETVKLFTTKQPNSNRGLGWDIKSAVGSSAGSLFGDSSYGHTGFTGTSVWTDPDRKLIVIFFTNRVYPTRENNKIISVRKHLHNAVINSIEN